jgi:hypothetical protein
MEAIRADGTNVRPLGNHRKVREDPNLAKLPAAQAGVGRRAPETLADGRVAVDLVEQRAK